MAITRTQEPEVSQQSDLQLWAGVLLGPIAWTLDEGLSYSLEQHACSTGHFYVLYVLTVVTLILALSGSAISWRQLTIIGKRSEEGGNILDRSRWMARLGIALGIGFAVVIIALAVPKVLLNPCS
jgi:uncharacterized membrane protein